MEKKQYYSIRKLAVGATSVVIGALFFVGNTTAFASEGLESNISINYVAESELTDYEKTLVKQGVPEKLKNGETYYLVYKNDTNIQKDKLPNTGIEELPIKGLGIATAFLIVVLVSKKNRNKILSIVLIGALGYSVVLPSSAFALENKLLAGYNHILTDNSKFEDSILQIDGYKYVGYLTLNDVLLESGVEEQNIQDNINITTRPSDNLSVVEEKPSELIKNNIEDKYNIKENLTDVEKNDDDNIPLPVIIEEVLSETMREEEIEIEDENNITDEKTPSNENISNERLLSTDNIVEKNTKETPQTSSEIIESINKNEEDIVENNNNVSDTDKIVVDSKETGSKVEDETNNRTIATKRVDTNKTEMTNKLDKLNSSTNKESIQSTKEKKKVKVVERIVKVTETIPYKVVYEEDENMESGTTKVVKEGTVGEKTTIQKVVINNGVELKREVTSSEVVQKEVDKVIKVGTKGYKKSNSKLVENNVDSKESYAEKNLIPKKETVYTEIVENKQRVYIRDYPKLEEATKEIKNDIGMLTKKEDNLSMLNITNIFDDSLFEGERRFENVMMYYVQTNLKRKREFENQEEIIDTIISKQVPVITGVMRIGTRKQGFETLKSDGKLVNISSDLDEKEVKNIKLSNNSSYVLDEEVPGYLGSAIDVEYEKDFKNTKLGLKFNVESLKADSKPTIYNYDKKTQLLEELDTQILGNMVYSTINKSGAYIVLDKKIQDEKLSTTTDYIPNDSNIGDKINNNINRKKIKKSVVFALDSSGSMRDNDKDGLRKKLTKEFIKKLNPENDKISVVDFDDKIHINKPLTSNFSEVLSDVDNIDDEGGTNVYQAIKTGIDILNSEKEINRKKYLFILTDGKDDLGWFKSTPSEEEYNEVIEKAKESGIVIYTIGFESTDEDLLKKIADKTGGKVYLKKEAIELPEIFDQLNEEIENHDTDFNKDGISAYYTREILTGNLKLATLKQSPYFKKQIEIAREKISKEYNIDIKDIAAISNKIKSLDDRYIEGLLVPDYDKDDLLNGNEARPEKNHNGKAFLYVLSDPENPDTDNDGIRDDKDGYTDLDKKDKNGNNKLEMTSNTEDTDRDGYDDAFEKRNGIDSFGVKFDSGKWNVGDRDLLMFSDLAYFDFKEKSMNKFLSDIAELARNSEEFGKVFEKNKFFNREIFNDLHIYDNNSVDKKFFDKWKYLGSSKLPYYYFVNSDVAWFENGENLVIAFRGTDEKFLELVTDLTILPNQSRAENRAEEQIKAILSKVANEKKTYKNVYVVGHSLGGYQAYYAFIKAFEVIKEMNSSALNSVENISVVNFNGPGLIKLGLKYKELEKRYHDNNNSVKSFEIDESVVKGFLNGRIVNGFGHFSHPNHQKKSLAYLKDKYRISPIYPHNLDSFYAHIKQGTRDTQDKFDIIDKSKISRMVDSISQNIKKVVTGAGNLISKGIEKVKSWWK